MKKTVPRPPAQRNRDFYDLVAKAHEAVSEARGAGIIAAISVSDPRLKIIEGAETSLRAALELLEDLLPVCPYCKTRLSFMTGQWSNTVCDRRSCQEKAAPMEISR